MKKKLILKAQDGTDAPEKEKGGGFNDFMNSQGTAIALRAAGNAMGIANKAIFQNSRYASDPLANTQAEVRTGISDALMESGNPYAMTAGLVTKVVDGALDATGLRSDNISKKVAKKADISGAARLANNFANFFPGNPLAIGGPKLNDSFKSEETEQVRGAYSGSLGDIDAAQTMGGGRVNFLLGGARGKINDMIDKANRKNELIAGISRTNTMRKQSDAAMDLNNQNFAKYQGMNYQSMAIGKEGMKLMSKSEVAAILHKENLSSIQTLQNGGVIGIDTNILPEGALHKNKNNLEDVNPEIGSEVTEKGIPVISTDENGEIKQVAEIEKEEIILRKEVTTRIEELWKDGSEEAMIEAGKLLAEEIITNTQDNTGQLENE